jgi:hypothetical protein
MIADAFECACAYEPCVGPRDKTNILKAFPLDKVDDIGDMGVQIDALA